MANWDLRFLLLAKHIAQWSKDPSTKTGAVIVDPFNRIISTGYNGFPRGVLDFAHYYEDRNIKYERILHCEVNAILFAQQSLRGCSLYTWPFLSCARCAAQVIQVGIARHVAPMSNHPRFGEAAQAISRQMFDEAGVDVNLIGVKDEEAS